MSSRAMLALVLVLAAIGLSWLADEYWPIDPEVIAPYHRR